MPDPRVEWEAIGASFARARARPWPEVLEWARRSVPPGGLVLDLGSGGGRHGAALAATGFGIVALDLSRSALEIAYARGLRAVLGDAGRLPLQGGTFDAVVFVAALHHLPSREARRLALGEVQRVLRPSGALLVTVWYRGEEGAGDDDVPWGTGARRFYHFYRRGELADDLAAAGFASVTVEEAQTGAGPKARNLFATARRTPEAR